MKSKAELDLICGEIIGACIEVHQALGPGLLEKIYQDCLCHELTLRGLKYRKEFSIPVTYKEVVLNTELRADLLVEESVIVEIKAVTEMYPIFEAQLISYLRLADIPQGLLINFNVTLLKDGLKKLFRNSA